MSNDEDGAKGAAENDRRRSFKENGIDPFVSTSPCHLETDDRDDDSVIPVDRPARQTLANNGDTLREPIAPLEGNTNALYTNISVFTLFLTGV
mmetsp:Transcript_24180/g.28146  ORF Transcript_24180/g.28146 Transcript_24180/m.28146 type:complete len:93 (+) Transcript_24180:474-752(+)